VGTTNIAVRSDPLWRGANTGIVDRGLMNRPIGAGIMSQSVSGVGGSTSRRIGGQGFSLPYLNAAPRSITGLESPLSTKSAYTDLSDPLAITKPAGIRGSTQNAFAGGSAAAALPDGGAAGMSGTALSGGGSTLVNDVGGAGISSSLNNPSAFSLARVFVQDLERASKSLLKQRTEAITTLVPEQESVYRTYMLRGDKAFRQSNYREAYANFQIASDLGNRDPESLICLLHAEFALSTVNYAKPCYYLEQSLRYMPELPLTNLRPRGFYESQAKYAQQLQDLQDHVAKNADDHEATLILVYFRWFEQQRNVDEIKNLLSAALAAAEQKKDPLIIEAIETFWRGMVASGAASGQLVARNADSPQTTPAQ
jgi:hypothetical protein